MPDLRQLKTAYGEAALAQLAIRMVDYRRLMTESFPGTGRTIRRLGLTRHANALTDLVAVSEHFTVARLLSARPTATSHEVRSWIERQKAWKKYTGVRLESYAAWNPLLGYVEVRNALQHGLGRLTSQQLNTRRDQILGQIRAAGVQLNGDRVEVTEVDVDRRAMTCSGFVIFLDSVGPRPFA